MRGRVARFEPATERIPALLNTQLRAHFATTVNSVRMAMHAMVQEVVWVPRLSATDDAEFVVRAPLM